MARLREVDTVAARALEFAILTAARSGEVYGATWAEIDPENRVWVIPAERMKAARKHRVPLCDRAAAIVAHMSGGKISAFVFPGRGAGNPLSHIAMAKVLRRMGVGGATVHGFRSAFRDWAGNETKFAREVAEAALAHVGDKAEQAYRRGDALDSSTGGRDRHGGRTRGSEANLGSEGRDGVPVARPKSCCKRRRRKTRGTANIEGPPGKGMLSARRRRRSRRPKGPDDHGRRPRDQDSC